MARRGGDTFLGWSGVSSVLPWRPIAMCSNLLFQANPSYWCLLFKIEPVLETAVNDKCLDFTNCIQQHDAPQSLYSPLSNTRSKDMVLKGLPEVGDGEVNLLPSLTY